MVCVVVDAIIARAKLNGIHSRAMLDRFAYLLGIIGQWVHIQRTICIVKR